MDFIYLIIPCWIRTRISNTDPDPCGDLITDPPESEPLLRRIVPPYQIGLEVVQLDRVLISTVPYLQVMNSQMAAGRKEGRQVPYLPVPPTVPIRQHKEKITSKEITVLKIWWIDEVEMEKYLFNAPRRTWVTRPMSRVSFLIWLKPAMVAMGTNWSASIWVLRYSS